MKPSEFIKSKLWKYEYSDEGRLNDYNVLGYENGKGLKTIFKILDKLFISKEQYKKELKIKENLTNGYREKGIELLKENKKIIKTIKHIIKCYHIEVENVIDECEIFEIRQDLEQEGVEYPLIDKKELKQKLKKKLDEVVK